MFSCPVVIRAGRAVCRLPRRVVTLEAPAALLAALASCCDGDTPLERIRARLASRWSAGSVRKLLDALEREGVLVDADQAALAAWPLVENPGRRPAALPAEELATLLARGAADRALSAAEPRAASFGLARVLARRSTTRRFGREPVAAEKIRAMLWAAYGVAGAHRTVPSGGALYPLEIHLVVLRPSAGIPGGVYAVRYRADGGVSLARRGAAAREVYRAYIDPAPVRSAQGAIVISGRFPLSARKYGSRALLLVTLEAGHAAQNAMLAATQLGVGAAEIAGFFEDRLRRLLKLAPAATPLTSILFGAPARAPRQAAAQPEFGWIELERPCAFELGAATFPGWKEDGDVCWGRDRDPLVAHDKALAEAWERLGCERPAEVQVARGRDLPGAVDPASLVAYLPGQYRRPGFPFKPYSGRREYGWRVATDYFNGRAAPVLAEFVYHRRALPPRLRAQAYTAATSSGVAAHPDAEQALRRAVLELVERDAFMTAWLGRGGAPRIAPRSMPRSLQQRLRALRDAGFHVEAFDLSRGLAPVVLLFARNAARAITSVAASADFDAGRALEHAWMELEATLLVKLQSDPPPAIEPEAVRDPLDHAAVYSQRRWYRRADRLLRRQGSIDLSKAGQGAAKGWNGLLDRIRAGHRRLLCLELTPPGAALDQGRRPLHVVRALVPGLLPISFGFGCEPLGIPRAAALLGRAKIASLSTGRSTLFPHPFA